MRGYNPFRFTKKPLFKGETTPSSLLTSIEHHLETGRDEHGHRNTHFFFFFYMAHSTQAHFVSQYTVTDIHRASMHTKLVKDEREENLSQVKLGDPSREISPLAKWRAPLARQVIPAVTPRAECLFRRGRGWRWGWGKGGDAGVNKKKRADASSWNISLQK